MAFMDTREEKNVFTSFISTCLTSRLREEAIEKVYQKISSETMLYCKNKTISPGQTDKGKRFERIQIILKGGQALKILASNFISLIDTTPELRAHLLALKQDILQTPKSDLDFSVYIDPALPNFDDIHSDVQKIAYDALVNYKKHIDNVEEVHKAIDRLFEMDSDIGRSFLKDIMNASGNGIHAIPVGLSDKQSVLIVSRLRTLVDARLRVSPFYMTVNNRIAWQSSSWLARGEMQQTEFSLLRIKVNMKAMRGLSAEDIPGELVDISIPLQNDINLHRFYKKISSGNYIIRILNRLSSEVRIQSVSGIMADFVNILMNIDEGGRYPWAVTKSRKRVSRLAFLWFLHFYISWMADSNAKPSQRWQNMNIFAGLFVRQTYGVLSDIEERQFETFRTDFERQLSVYQEIMKKIGSFTDRTRSNVDKKLKDIACRIDNECYMKVQNY